MRDVKASAVVVDGVDMRHELTLGQARDIARLRRRHPGAELRVHQRSWGVLVEVVQGLRTVTVEPFAFRDGDRAVTVVDLAA